VRLNSFVGKAIFGYSESMFVKYAEYAERKIYVTCLESHYSDFSFCEKKNSVFYKCSSPE